MVRSLCEKEVFDGVMQSPCYKLRNKWVTLLASPSSISYSRVGFIMSRKRVHSAVLRNALKRHARQVIRNWESSARVTHQVQYGLDVIVLVHGLIPRLANKNIDQHMRLHCSTAQRKALCRDLRLLLHRMCTRVIKL